MNKSIRVLGLITSLTLSLFSTVSTAETSVTTFNGIYAAAILSKGADVKNIQKIMPKFFVEIGVKEINNANNKLGVLDAFIERDGNKEYLIYVMDNMTEIAFEVIDDNTLVRLTGGAPTTYHKVNGTRLVKL